MPEINKQFTLQVTPEQFLDACSAEELMEIDLLIQAPRYQSLIKLGRADAAEDAKDLIIPVVWPARDNTSDLPETTWNYPDHHIGESE